MQLEPLICRSGNSSNGARQLIGSNFRKSTDYR
jgi:hypothetical protein